MLKENAFIGSSLIRMYSSCGCLMEAHNVLDTSQAQDVVMWTSMIGGYCMHEYHTKAFECFEQMQAKGFSPNVVTFISILKACAHAGAMERIEEIVMKIEIKGWLEKEFFLGCALIDMYVKCMSLEESRFIFNELVCRDLISWSIMISGYANSGQISLALQLFVDMQQEGKMPNNVIFVCIIKLCPSVDMVKLIHSQIVEGGFEPDIVITNVS